MYLLSSFSKVFFSFFFLFFLFLLLLLLYIKTFINALCYAVAWPKNRAVAAAYAWGSSLVVSYLSTSCSRSRAWVCSDMRGISLLREITYSKLNADFPWRSQKEVGRSVGSWTLHWRNISDMVSCIVCMVSYSARSSVTSLLLSKRLQVESKISHLPVILSVFEV